MKVTYFDLREELKQRFIAISAEPGAEDEPLGSAEVIAEANNDCAFMKEIQKSIAKKMAEAAGQSPLPVGGFLLRPRASDWPMPQRQPSTPIRIAATS